MLSPLEAFTLHDNDNPPWIVDGDTESLSSRSSSLSLLLSLHAPLWAAQLPLFRQCQMLLQDRFLLSSASKTHLWFIPMDIFNHPNESIKHISRYICVCVCIQPKKAPTINGELHNPHNFFGIQILLQEGKNPLDCARQLVSNPYVQSVTSFHTCSRCDDMETIVKCCICGLLWLSVKLLFHSNCVGNLCMFRITILLNSYFF